jgi:glycosyltransferase involved in cell wall biosynthesis
MRVGLVLHGLDRPLSGVTRVALELARALPRQPGIEVVYLTTYRRGPFRVGEDVAAAYLPGCERVPGLMALGGPEIAVAARRLRLDVVHDPVGVSPFTLGRWAGSYRRVVTIHDAIAYRYPEGYSWSNNFLHRRFVPASLRNVDAVVTVSDHAKADIRRFLHLPETRVHVVPNGVSDRFRPVDARLAADVARRHGLERPFILYVGTRQARKNLVRLLAAFARLRTVVPSHDLALVGPTGPGDRQLEQEIEARALGGHARLLPPVADEDLPAIYSAASLFVFPSLYEGFGLPVIEAMACGTPVVCSDATALPEVAGGAALLVDATKSDLLSEGMARVLTEPTLGADLRRRGTEHARGFTWDAAARATLGVYRSVASERNA